MYSVLQKAQELVFAVNVSMLDSVTEIRYVSAVMMIVMVPGGEPTSGG